MPSCSIAAAGNAKAYGSAGLGGPSPRPCRTGSLVTSRTVGAGPRGSDGRGVRSAAAFALATGTDVGAAETTEAADPDGPPLGEPETHDATGAVATISASAKRRTDRSMSRSRPGRARL